MATEEEYNEIFKQLLEKFTVDFSFEKRPFAEFKRRMYYQSDSPTREEHEMAIMRAHQSRIFGAMNFRNEVFDEVLKKIQKLGRSRVDSSAMMRDYIDEYNRIEQGQSPKDPHSVAWSLAFSAVKLGEALNRPQFGFEFRKALLPKYHDLKTAMFAEDEAEHILNEALYNEFLPRDFVKRLIENDRAFSLHKINMILNGRAKILEYPPNSTPAEREKIRKQFEKEFIAKH